VAGIETYPATAARGRTTTTDSEFTLRIDPENAGVMLRRKLDYAYPNQRAEVYIKDARDPRANWQPAGIWYTAGSNTVVRSYGGTEKFAGALERLYSLLQRAGAVRMQIAQGDRKLKIPAFIGSTEALNTLNRLPTRQELTSLETQTRNFLTKVNGGQVLRAPREIVSYATQLSSAQQALLSAGYESDLFEKAELGATEHVTQVSNRRFRDDEFLVPRSLTQGRSSIRIRIVFTPVRTPLYPGRPLPSLAWSEMRYCAYSFVAPRHEQQ